jgi:hypothetical protein
MACFPSVLSTGRVSLSATLVDQDNAEELARQQSGSIAVMIRVLLQLNYDAPKASIGCSGHHRRQVGLPLVP